MVGVRRLSLGVDQNRNMIKSGKGRGSGHDLLGDGPMVGMHEVMLRRFSLGRTKIAVWPSWERLWLAKDNPVIGLDWCIEWLRDWLNLLRLEYTDPNLESWTSDTSHVFVWVLDGPSTVVEVANEKEQGERCNKLVRKNQSSMLHVPDAKSLIGTNCLETGRQHHWIRGRIHPKWERLVMSSFLELDMGHRLFNRNETALVQIMGIDREQDVAQLAGILDHSAETAGSQLNSSGWSVGSSDQCDSYGRLLGWLMATNKLVGRGILLIIMGSCPNRHIAHPTLILIFPHPNQLHSLYVK
ncbi:hypothetical protein F2Q69_00042922 [Brassica cretica]|uniref:Uncharacterized protein n=1 Tax=Brassica cretica TaxID=69181 RepID=A0A8S9N4N5_BRACR|nr:hypothetical protein F2Q69_00042922 [Brassica cretica]